MKKIISILMVLVVMCGFSTKEIEAKALETNDANHWRMQCGGCDNPIYAEVLIGDDGEMYAVFEGTEDETVCSLAARQNRNDGNLFIYECYENGALVGAYEGTY